jgi:hypothetical protein
MKLFKKKCAYCKKKIKPGKEIFAEVKLPEFVQPKVKAFCSEEHYNHFIQSNQGTKSRKPYCLKCDD